MADPKNDEPVETVTEAPAAEAAPKADAEPKAEAAPKPEPRSGTTLPPVARWLKEMLRPIHWVLTRLYLKVEVIHAERIPVDARDPVALVLFPEMDADRDVPEITEACWGILGRTPDSVMCSSSRMVVRRRGAAGPSVVACTLLPYETEFDLGATLREASRPVALNHPHCARFCVLGGAACSR